MDALLSPKFRTKTQKFYYQHNPDQRSNDITDSSGGAVASPITSSRSADDSPTSRSSPSRGKPSYFTFEHEDFPSVQ